MRFSRVRRRKALRAVRSDAWCIGTELPLANHRIVEPQHALVARRVAANGFAKIRAGICTIVVLGMLVACAPVPERPGKPPARPERGAASAREQIWHLLGGESLPARAKVRDRHRYDRTLESTSVPGFQYFHYAPVGDVEPVGFVMLNRGSKSINPRGLKKRGATRRYSFFFPDRARENIHLEINDDVSLSGRYSYDNMFREMHFFPRLMLPSVRRIDGGRKLRVTLPTGEPTVFDAIGKEIVAGVLLEQPIDFSRQRHGRANPRVKYRGEFLMITVAQRGEAARRARVWGQTKYAHAHYPAKYAKACRLSPADIWDQRPKPGDVDPRLTMRHHSDASLFDLVERQCGWDLGALREVAGS